MKFQKIAADPFHRLPDELLLSILSRLADLKSLCQCSLVSKRFASVIPQTRIVSVNIAPSNGEHTCNSYHNIRELLLALSRACAVEELPDFLVPSLQKLKLPKFLDKFRELETVCLEYGDPSKNKHLSFPKWKVQCSRSAVIENLVILLPASIHKETEEESRLEQIVRECSRGDVISLSIVGCMEWMCLVCMLVKTHTSLKRVTITGEQSKLTLRHEQLVKLRICVPLQERLDFIPRNIHCAWIPIVHLPLSGYIIRGASLMIINFPAESWARNDDLYDEMMSWDFDDNEKIFGEALKEILKNHRHKFKVC